MKKIGFSGFKGCGKTTLLDEVRKILSLKSKTQQTAKSDINNPFDEDKKLLFNSQFFNFSQCINQENLLFDNSSGFLLCDTTILDYYVLWQQYLKDKEKTPTLIEKDTLLKYIFQFWIKTYDVLFFIRVKLNKNIKWGSKPEINNSIDPEYVNNIEKNYLQIISEYDFISFEIWNNTSIDESAHKMIEIISQSNNE